MHKSKDHSQILPGASVYEYGSIDYAFRGQCYDVGCFSLWPMLWMLLHEYTLTSC